ncbi:MAG: type II secretion system protein [Lentisphaeria bacterium]|nr:type II secretion system protein [Bacillota bacterium]MBR4255283.1 type II secretion system protein [Lentisphaeria bacterium]
MKRRAGMRSVTGFTLIEVIIAIGILAISLASLFQIIASSRARIAKADEAWHNMHMLTQAAEYVLLHRADVVDSVDRDFFPYRDYQVNISYEEVSDEQIDDDFASISGQLPLDLCIIELVNLKTSGKETVGTLEIERIIYEDDGLEPE